MKWSHPEAERSVKEARRFLSLATSALADARDRCGMGTSDRDAVALIQSALDHVGTAQWKVYDLVGDRP